MHLHFHNSSTFLWEFRGIRGVPSFSCCCQVTTTIWLRFDFDMTYRQRESWGGGWLLRLSSYDFAIDVAASSVYAAKYCCYIQQQPLLLIIIDEQSSSAAVTSLARCTLGMSSRQKGNMVQASIYKPGPRCDAWTATWRSQSFTQMNTFTICWPVDDCWKDDRVCFCRRSSVGNCKLFWTHVYLTVTMRGSMEMCKGAKPEWWGYLSEKKFDDLYSFGYNARVWRTYGQNDWRIDGQTPADG